MPRSREHNPLPRDNRGAPIRAVVLVFDTATDEEEQRHSVNLRNGKKIEWLTNLLRWAVLNGRAVEIVDPEHE